MPRVQVRLNMKTYFQKLSIAASLTYGILCGAPLALADEPAINAQQLGIIEGALKYCGSIDQESAKKLQAKADEIAKGASAASLEQARSSDAYHKARNLVEGFISQVDEHNAKAACSDTAANK